MAQLSNTFFPFSLGVETLQSDIAIGDVEGRGADSDLSENTVRVVIFKAFLGSSVH